MIEEHSKLFGFSGASRWSACPGSISMNELEENPESEASRLGTATHWVGEIMLHSFKDRIDGIGTQCGGDAIGQPAPNGVVVTDEMYDAALTYYREIVDTVHIDVARKRHLTIEERVRAESIDDQAWGTLDAAWYHAEKNTLHIWDFKNGHRRVEAFENLQLVGYAQAYCETHNMTELNPRLVLSIVQPRCYDGRPATLRWETTLDEIRGHTNALRQAAAEHNSGTAKLVTGAWCRDCLSRRKCPAIRDAVAAAVDYSTDSIPHHLSDDALAYELDVTAAAEERLKQRRTALVAEAEGRITKGSFVPGYQMKMGTGQNAWTKPDAEVIMMGDLMGVDLRSPTKAISSFQMIKKFKQKGVDESVMKPYYAKKQLGLKLVADDGSKAKQVFSHGKLINAVKAGE